MTSRARVETGNKMNANNENTANNASNAWRGVPNRFGEVICLGSVKFLISLIIIAVDFVFKFYYHFLTRRYTEKTQRTTELSSYTSNQFYISNSVNAVSYPCTSV